MSRMGDPVDVSDKSNALPTSEVFHSQFEILPKRSTLDPAEIGHHDEKPDLTALEGALQGGNNDIAVVGRLKLPACLKSNDSRR